MSPQKDKTFFDDGFGDVTFTKLEIYEKYLQEWLPVPLSGRMRVNAACVYDLFCGPGKDSNGNSGSPLIARKVLYKNTELLRNSNVPTNLIFNDYNVEHISDLKKELGADIHNQKGESLATIEYHSEEFDSFFPTVLQRLDGKANLLFIDQFGAIAIKEEIFKTLSQHKQTDVLFFIATNWFRRFSDRPESKDWNFSKEDISKVDYNHIHRFMADHFRGLIGDNDYYVAPFSLKKGANIYGLVFASHSPKGVEKFLKVAWSLDPHTGEANFDIDNEGVSKDQVLLFDARKVTEYQEELESKILNEEFDTDSDIYLHMLRSGFLNKLHTRPVVGKLIKGSLIEFQKTGGIKAQPRLSFDATRDPRRIVYLK